MNVVKREIPINGITSFPSPRTMWPVKKDMTRPRMIKAGKPTIYKILKAQRTFSNLLNTSLKITPLSHNSIKKRLYQLHLKTAIVRTKVDYGKWFSDKKTTGIGARKYTCYYGDIAQVYILKTTL